MTSQSMLRKEVIDTSNQQFTNMIDKLNLNDAFENRGYRGVQVSISPKKA